MLLVNRRVPPLLHMLQRSPHIDQSSIAFTRTGVDLLRTEQPLRAGVSSFGFSGTNAHVVLQETSPGQHAHSASKRLLQLGTSNPQYFVLSAKSKEALRQLSKRYRDWLTLVSEVCWQDVCYSLQVGRNHLQYRLAFLVGGIAEAIRCLDSYLSDATLPEKLTCQCTKAFMAGASIDWLVESAKVLEPCVQSNLLPVQPATRIALPTYPFQHESYWVRGVQQSPVRKANHFATKNPWTNSSHNFSPDEWLRLGDHRLFGAAVMPAVAWLDIISRAAQRSDERAFQLKNIRFIQMLALSSATRPIFETRFFTDSPAINEFGIFASQTAASKFELDKAYVRGEIEVVENIAWLGGDLQSIRNRHRNELDARRVYERFGAIGFDYGPHFRKLVSLSTDDNSALGALDVTDDEIDTEADASSCHGLLDSALHAVAGAAWKDGYDANDATTFFPVAIHALQWFDRTKSPKWSMALIRPATDEFAIEADLFIWNTSSQPVLQLLGIRFEGFANPNPIKSSMKSAIPASTAVINLAAEQLTTAQLLALPVDEQLPTLQEYLRVQLAHELEMPAEMLIPDQPLNDFGLDSLMVFRLGIQLETEFGFAVNSRAMMQGQSLRALAESLLWRLSNLSAAQE